MFEISDTNEIQVPGAATIRVIGVGGGGCNAVNTMIKAGLSGVEYIVANTDSQALNASLAPTKIQLGSEITKGLGAGANPEVGRKAALDEYEKLSEVLEGADMVFITAGMGGGTGTGAAPIIAKLCKELNVLTVGVVTKPFLFEGKKRFRQAQTGIISLEESVDSLITIPNQRLLYLAGESLSLIDTFKKADEVLLNAVRGISDLINTTGHINADFADVSTVMANKGLALMGTGLCSGPDRAIKAATEAISSPLLEDISIDGATGIIINITGNESLTMHETNEAVTLIMDAADDDAEIIFGSVIDDTLEDSIKVTVVATGLAGAERVTSASVTEKKSTNLESRATKDIQKQESWATPSRVSRDNETNIMTQQREMQNPAEVERPIEQIQAAPLQKRPLVETAVNNHSFPEREIRREVQVEKQTEIPSEARRMYDSRFDEGVTNTPVERHASHGLAKTIQSAASKYSSSKGETHANEEIQITKNDDVSASQRTKSIAERLGFMNFDEEELDTPTYLRRDHQNNNTESNHISEI